MNRAMGSRAQTNVIFGRNCSDSHHMKDGGAGLWFSVKCPLRVDTVLAVALHLASGRGIWRLERKG